MYFYLKCETLLVKLFSVDTATLLRTLAGHSSRITRLRFIFATAGSSSSSSNDPTTATLCSASADGTLSLWSASDGQRRHLLDEHTKRVVADVCVADTQGKRLVTVGWDCTARIWNVADASLDGQLRGHPRPINCVALSPAAESSVLATGGWDACVRLFNLVTRQRTAVLRGHTASIQAMAFAANGLHLATSALDGAVKLWNASIGCQVASLDSTAHRSPLVTSICFSSSSGVGGASGNATTPFFATASADRRVKLWPGTSGRLVRTIEPLKAAKSEAVTAVCFEPTSGALIAVGYHSGVVRLFARENDANANAPPLATLGVHENASVRKLRFARNGRHLLSVAADGSARLVQVLDGKSLLVLADLLTEKRSRSPLNALAISNARKVVATGSEEATLSLYTWSRLVGNNNNKSKRAADDDSDMFVDDDDDDDADEKKKPKTTTRREVTPTLSLSAHKSAITACAFNSSGDRLASVDKEASIVLWSVQMDDDDDDDDDELRVEELCRVVRGHADWITDIVWSNTSAQHFVTASNDLTLKIWRAAADAATHTTICTERAQLLGHTGNIRSLAFQYGCVVSTGQDGVCKLWSHRGHEITTLHGHRGPVNACDLWIKLKLNSNNNIKTTRMEEDEEEEAADLGTLWSDRVDEHEWLEKQSKHEQRREKKKQQRDEVGGGGDIVDISEVHLVTGSDDATVRLWRPIESEPLLSVENHADAVNSLDLVSNAQPRRAGSSASSSCCCLLATASADATVNLLHLNEAKSLSSPTTTRSTKHATAITCLCVSQTGAFVVIAFNLSILFEKKIMIQNVHH